MLRFFSTFTAQAKSEILIDLNVMPVDEQLDAYHKAATDYLSNVKPNSFEKILYLVNSSKPNSTYKKPSFLKWLKSYIYAFDKNKSITDFLESLPKQFAAYKKTLSASELELSSDKTAEQQFRESCDSFTQIASKFTPFSELLKILHICQAIKISIEGSNFRDESRKADILTGYNKLISRICDECLEHSFNVFETRLTLLMSSTIPPQYNYEMLLRAMNEGNIPDTDIDFLCWLQQDLQRDFSSSETDMEKDRSLSDLESCMMHHIADTSFAENYIDENSSTDPEEIKADERLDTSKEPLLLLDSTKQSLALLSPDERYNTCNAVIQRLPSFAMACEIETALPLCIEMLKGVAQIQEPKEDKENAIKNMKEKLTKKIELTIQRIVLFASQQGIYIPPYDTSIAHEVYTPKKIEIARAPAAEHKSPSPTRG